MANNRINRYIGAIVVGTVLTAVPGCTDTWDDHYNSGESVSGTTQTLWDIISDSEKHPEFSRFADIVRNAKYYKDNTHMVETYSYADILSGGQVNTVWVPDNDALSEAEYQKWMDMLTNSRADGDGSSIVNGYNVQQQFLGNHIALWRHNISEPGVDTVKMINGKNLTFDKGNLTIEGIPLDKEKYNIPTANGVMHVIKGVTPFRYNLYEHLKFGTPDTKFSQYVVKQDTTYFSESQSIEGKPDENGNPTYVDSVYFTTNLLFMSTKLNLESGSDRWQMAKAGFGAAINHEDSAFVMLMPTDAAWEQAYNKLAASHVYGTTYEDKSKGDEGETKDLKIEVNPDSLQKLSVEMDIISPLVFNINKQPKTKGGEMWKLEMFDSRKSEFDGPESYMLNTFGDTLRTVGDWNPSSLFDAQAKEMSNGLAYEVNSWNFPKEFYTPDVEVEIENNGVFYNRTNSSKYKVGPRTDRYTFSNDNFKDITSIYGKVSNNNFYHLAPYSANAGAKVDIKLEGNSPSAYVPKAQVMSGKYDIQVVFVPYWYLDLASYSNVPFKYYNLAIDTLVNDTIIDGVEYSDTTYYLKKGDINRQYVDSIAKLGQYSFKVSITNNNGKADKTTSLTSKAVTFNSAKVDTVTIFEDYEFPVSYKNMLYSYPTLTLEWAKPGKAPEGEAYVYDLIIDKVILKRKD